MQKSSFLKKKKGFVLSKLIKSLFYSVVAKQDNNKNLLSLKVVVKQDNHVSILGLRHNPLPTPENCNI